MGTGGQQLLGSVGTWGIWARGRGQTPRWGSEVSGFVVSEQVALPLPPSSCSWGPGFVLGVGDVAQLGAAGALCG